MRETIEFAAYRVGAALFGALPEPVARTMGEWLGWLTSFVSRQKLGLVRRNLARVVGSELATVRRTRRVFASYGRYWAEVFWVRASRRDEILANSEILGAEHITDAVAAGQGIVLALPHMGNWEAAGPAAASLGAPVLAVAESLRNRRIVDWFIDIRSQLGIDVILTGAERRTSGALLDRLKRGGTIALLADRDLAGTGIEVEFFGEGTTVPAGPAALADRTGAALIPVGCYFKQGRGHRFDVRDPIAIPEIADKTERIATVAQSLVLILEELIRAAPEQWHLFQPNWPSDRIQLEEMGS